MGESDLGFLYALFIALPFIVVGVFSLVGVFLLFRTSRTSKIIGVGMSLIAVIGIFGIPILNGYQQQRTTNVFLANAVLPKSVTMRDANVLVIGSPPECDLMCDQMLDGGYASKVTQIRMRQDSDRDIYHAAPFDLTSLQGAQYVNRHAPVTEQVTDDVDFILFNVTHWLAYHDEKSFLQFPQNAYSGIFLFRVTTPRAFDISQAELVLRIYRSEQKPAKYLWFSEVTDDDYLPSNVRIAEIFENILSKGTSQPTDDQ